jgi:hypothetical protein
MSGLDGLAGTTATAELDGGGRTTLLADGLQWQLLRQETLLPLTIPSQMNLVQQASPNNDKYLLTFMRPSPGGEYVLRWIVPNIGNLDDSFSTTDAIPGASSFVPTVDDVGALLRARTKDQFGNELGTFTADTRPTDDQVLVLIGQAYDYVTARVDSDLPQESWRAARSAIALKAAMLVELSYWPDQIPANQSPYAALRQEFDGGDGAGGELAGLVMSVNRENEELVAGEEPQMNTPRYNFNDNQSSIGMKTVW